MSYKITYHKKTEKISGYPSIIISSLGRIFLKPITSLIFILITTCALTIATIFYILQQNTNAITNKWNESAKLSLYIKKGVSLHEVTNLTEKIGTNHFVAKIAVIQPAEGMKYFTENTTFDTLIPTFKENPLPYVIIIHPKLELFPKNIASEFLKTLKNYPEVETVKANIDWIERGHNLINLWDKLSTIFFLVLTINALLVMGGSSYVMTRIFTAKNNTRTANTFLPYQFAWYGFISSIFTLLLVKSILLFIQNYSIILHDLNYSYGILIILLSALIGMICSKAATL